MGDPSASRESQAAPRHDRRTHHEHLPCLWVLRSKSSYAGVQAPGRFDPAFLAAAARSTGPPLPDWLSFSPDKALDAGHPADFIARPALPIISGEFRRPGWARDALGRGLHHSRGILQSRVKIAICRRLIVSPLRTSVHKNCWSLGYGHRNGVFPASCADLLHQSRPFYGTFTAVLRGFRRFGFAKGGCSRRTRTRLSRAR